MLEDLRRTAVALVWAVLAALLVTLAGSVLIAAIIAMIMTSLNMLGL